MINLPDYGYQEHSVSFVDSGGVAEGSLGGPSDYIARPGLRFSVHYTLPPLPSDNEARLFQSMLERGLREDVSYPFPLDFRPPQASGGQGAVNGSVPAGSSLPLRNLYPSYPFYVGQPLAVVSSPGIAAGGLGSIHRVTAAAIADGSGLVTLSVFPWTRTAFVDGNEVEIERPRIRGILSWDGSTQPAHGKRPFSFTITERK